MQDDEHGSPAALTSALRKRLIVYMALLGLLAYYRAWLAVGMAAAIGVLDIALIAALVHFSKR